MAAPTLLDVSVDSDEYSRYEEAYDTITVTLAVSGGAPYTAEDITVDLVKARKSRDAVVATTTVSITATSDPQESVITFYLPDIVDQDLIHLVRHGKYFVRATSVTDSGVTAESGDFYISIITVDRFKTDYLFGIPLTATESRAPKFQPQQVSGVTVTEINPTHKLGPVVLNYIYHKDPTANATATIGSGVDGTVTITADTDYAGDVGNDYSVEVVVPAGTSGLSVSLVSTTVTVNLAVVAGVPDDPQNTATLVAAAITALANFTATASGTGASSLTAAEGPTSFTGGTSDTVRQINWNGGPLVSLTQSGTFVLTHTSTSGPQIYNTTQTDYVLIRVSSTVLLPTQNVTETLIIDKKTFDDTSIRNYINKSIDWVEKDFLMTPIEPTNVVTERDPTTVQFAAGVNAPAPIFTDTDFDLIVSPLTYYPKQGATWIDIQTPWPQLLRVDSLFGAIANTRVIDVDLEWIEHSEQGGLIQLVPYNQEIAFDFVGLIWVNAIRGATELPNFWHYNAIVGLREATGDVRELVAKKAAIDALTAIGAALRPGVGSVSLSRDGVSESVSYITSAMYGVYTGQITAHKEWIEDQGKLLRAKYKGPTLLVV